MKDTNTEFNYMLLGRLQQDTLYYEGNGNGCAKHLYHLDPIKHYDEMEKLWNSLEEKPIWLTKKDLEEYRIILKGSNNG